MTYDESLYVTLASLRSYSACPHRYEHLCQALGSTYGDDVPIRLSTILKINGLSDALWALRAVVGQEMLCDRLSQLLACAFVRQTPLPHRQMVWHLLSDELKRVVEIGEEYTGGKATAGELAAAEAAAWATGAAARAAAQHVGSLKSDILASQERFLTGWLGREVDEKA